MSKELKIVWLCTVNNRDIYSRIQLSSFVLIRLKQCLLGRPVPKFTEKAQWNTNAIKEFEKFEDIKLSVIFPYDGIKGRIQNFSINGIEYFCYRTDDDFLSSFVKIKIFRRKKDYPKTRKIVSFLISKIKPDVVHVIGAENPNYSICALDVPKTIPCVVSLQTLLSFPGFKDNYPMGERLYQYRSYIEQSVLKRSDYIASTMKPYNDYIRKYIKTDAIFLNMKLAVGVEVNMEKKESEYDFVYFAKNIKKAADDALNAFALAHNENPSLTLNISGSYDPDYKIKLEERIMELNLEKCVYITGSKQTHDEVLNQIKKSRFALLPLKVDLISSTVREAMACGLPVVTTITPATPDLNARRESVLLSNKGDYKGMAHNMLRLVCDTEYANQIRENAVITIQEKYSNEALMKQWRKAYFEIIDNFRNESLLSKDICSAD